MKRLIQKTLAITALLLCFLTLFSFMFAVAESTHEHEYQECAHCEQVAQFAQTLDGALLNHQQCGVSDCTDCGEISILQMQLQRLNSTRHACKTKMCIICEHIFTILKRIKYILIFTALLLTASFIVHVFQVEFLHTEKPRQAVTPIALKVKISD